MDQTERLNELDLCKRELGQIIMRDKLLKVMPDSGEDSAVSSGVDDDGNSDSDAPGEKVEETIAVCTSPRKRAKVIIRVPPSLKRETRIQPQFVSPRLGSSSSAECEHPTATDNAEQRPSDRTNLDDETTAKKESG